MTDNDIKNTTESPQPDPGIETGKKERRHLIRNGWIRIPLKTVMWIIVVVIILPVLLYVPPVQTFVKNIACDYVYKSTGMKVGIDRFRLKWPLDVSLSGVTVLEASGDTMVNAREVIADVKLMPLMKLDVQINKLSLLDGYYRMVSPDSSMVLKIKAGELNVDDQSSANMADSRILLHKADLKRGDVSLFMNVWKQKPTPADSTSAPFFISADELDLEDFTFSMSMLPTIDTLRFNTSSLRLRKGIIDLGKNLVSVGTLSADSGNVVYLTPTAEYIASHPAPAPDSTAVQTPSAPMVIKGDSVSLSGFSALYAVKDAVALPGFDPSYIQVTDVNIGLKNFYNAATTIELPIASVTAKERSGLQITGGSGLFTMDSVGMNLRDFEIKTPFSSISATAGIPNALMELKPDAPVSVEASGNIGFPDVEAFMPSLKVYTQKLPKRNPLKFNLLAEGKLSDVTIPKLEASLRDVFDIKAKGKAKNVLDFNKLSGNLDFYGNLENPGIADNLLGDMGFKLPAFTLKGKAAAANRAYTADFNLRSTAGDVAANGKVSLNSEAYNADVRLHGVDVAHFMPDLGVGKVTASLKAHGAGFNPEKPNASTDIMLDVASVTYMKKELKNIVADVTLHNGAFTINAMSENDAADFHIEGSGTLAKDLYTFDVTGSLANLDLHALGVTSEANHGKGDIHIAGSASPGKWIYDIDLNAHDFEWTAGNQYFSFAQPIALSFNSFADRVTANLDAGLTYLDFDSHTGLKNIIDAFTHVSDTVAKQIERRNINVETLQSTLPPFSLAFNASGKGTVGKYLNTIGMSVDTIHADIVNDSLIWGNVGILNLANSSMRADTLSLLLNQRRQLLDYKIHMGNRQNNPIAEFADVNVNGYLGENRILVSLTQKNQKRETGYRLGFTAAMADSTVTVHFTPRKATIAYLPWTFNADNYVDYAIVSHKVNANLMAESNESSIALVTKPGKAGNNELNVDIKNLKVQDFLQMSVFAPPLTAAVDASLRVGYNKNWLYGGGNVDVRDFTYDRQRVGDFALKIGAGLNDNGTTGAGASLKIDGIDALSANLKMKPDSLGNVAPERVALKLKRFPLHIANAFLGADVARLSGYLKGNLDMKGTFTAPVLNGVVACDSVGVFIPMIGSSLSFGKDSISLADNVIDFNEFDIWGANKNPMKISGTVDARKFSNIMLDLGMSADNFQLIGNDKKARSDIYGKLFLDLAASAKGPLEHINVNADLNILSQTDVTYSVPQTTTAELKQQNMGDVVKFVNFNDTAVVQKIDTVAPAMAMRIVAGLTIQPGAEVNVDIPGDPSTGNGKARIYPSGTLNYFQNFMGDMRLNGQLSLGNEGYVEYKFLSAHPKFEFKEPSTIVWNGDIMNPVLNISAADKVRTNLLQNGNSRFVNFLVLLKVTNNLAAPKVMFDLSTDDDMSISNDLKSMSDDQRSMAAINLLLTGQYSGQGVKTASSDFLTGNLYGYFTGQLNSWLANNVKGVDLSFGVDQYNKTVNGETGSATSYSYQMSKSLFNNKFRISVGGNYTTDASSDENFSENLINDISFEYMVKQTSDVTMYARLFRHTGYESILEGEITETGVGFVLKRRLSTLRDIFRWGHNRRKEETPIPADTTLTARPDSAAVVRNDSISQTAKEHEDK